MNLNATFYLLYSTEKLNDEIDFILVFSFFFEFEKVVEKFEKFSINSRIMYIDYQP